MEIINYTDQHKDFRIKARKFMEKEVIPNVEQWEKERLMPKSAWKKMGEAGFLCSTISPEYGGPGLDFISSMIVMEEITRTNHNGAGPLLHSEIVVPYVEAFATEECKRKYLPGCVSGDIIMAVAMTEPDVGSDLASLETSLVEDGDEVVVNGSKIFISNGINADLIVLAAKDPKVENPYKAIDLYLVEKDMPGFNKGQKLDKMGWYSQDTAELFFSDCRIPIGNRLGKKGDGFPMLMKKLQQERLVTALWGLTAAEFTFDQLLKLYRDDSGLGKPITKTQVKQFSLVELATELKIGRTFADKLLVDHMEGKDIVSETSMAKYWLTELARKVANVGLDIMAEAGVLKNNPIPRAFVDVRSMSIFAGTNEIMRQIVAKSMKI